MSAFTVTIVDDLTTRIAALAAAGENLQPVFRDIASDLRELTEDAFEAQAQPGGPAWPDLAPATKAARAKRGKWPGPKLQVTTRMASSLSAVAGGDYAQVGVAAVYAAIHQFGGDIAMPARSQRAYFRYDAQSGTVGNRFVRKSKSNFAQWATIGAHKIRIPARPYLPIDGQGQQLTQPGRQAVIDRLTQHFGAAIK